MEPEWYKNSLESFPSSCYSSRVQSTLEAENMESNDETLLSGLYILKAVDCWDDFQEPECVFGKAQHRPVCIMDFVCLRKFDQKLPAYSISFYRLDLCCDNTSRVTIAVCRSRQVTNKVETPAKFRGNPTQIVW